MINNFREINKYILEQMKSGNMDEKNALQLLERINLKQEKQSNEIAIIGMSCRFPGSNNKEEYWENLKSGVNSIKKAPLNRMEDAGFKTPKGGAGGQKAGYLDEIDKFDASYFRLSPKEAQLMDPFQRVFLEVCFDAIEDAGYNGKRITNTKTGVYVGVDTTNKWQYMHLSNEPGLLSLTGSLNSILASRVSYILNLHGPNLLIDTACSSGLVALHQASKAIQNGDCEMALAGGINLIIIPKDGGATKDLTSPDGETRAFDKNATGFSWGEGAGVVLLKSLEKAIEDGDNIYAVIKGSAINNDGASNGITAPNPEAQTEAVLTAWKQSGINPETISYIETHGTGTELGDPIEIMGLRSAFERYTRKKQFCGIGSVKTNIGHTIGASGMASLFKVVMAMKRSELPPSLNFKAPNPALNLQNSPLYINTKLKKWELGKRPRRACINALGISGTNCHVVLEEMLPEDTTRSIEVEPQILALSAKNISVLKELTKRFIGFLDNNNDLDLKSLCFTANTGRGHYSHRLAVIASTVEEFRDKIYTAYASDFRCENKGIFYGEHKIVGSSKNERQYGEITERERAELTEEAYNVIESFNEKRDYELFEDLCNLYTKGCLLEWEGLYHEQRIKKISLPTYPFERTRHWLDINAIKQKITATNQQIYYKAEWAVEALDRAKLGRELKTVLLIRNAGEFSEGISQRLRDNGSKVIEVIEGASYSKHDTCKYTLSNCEQDYFKLIQDIKAENVTHIIHTASINFNNNEEEENILVEELDYYLDRGVYSIFKLAKAINTIGLEADVNMILIADNAVEITGKEALIKPYNAAYYGFGKALEVENPRLLCRSIDIDGKTPIDTVIEEICFECHDSLVSYRGNTRYVELLKRLQLEKYEKANIHIKENGVYLITGGTGGIGLQMAKYLSSKQKVNIILLSRFGMPNREKWESILSSSDSKAEDKEKIGIIKEIESLGSEVKVYKADISVESDIEVVVEALKAQYGKIDGIMHCAGVAGEKTIVNKDLQMVKNVISPKAQGTWIIDKLTKASAPDFLILFSSIATLIPRAGQADYIAANSFLDAYAAYRNKRGVRTVSINWPVWKETGMGVKHVKNNENGIFNSITTQTALKALEDILERDIDRAIVCDINPDSNIGLEGLNLSVRLDNEIISQFADNGITKKSKRSTTVKLSGKPDDNYTATEKALASVWHQVLGVSEVSVYDNFYELGGDSIQAIKISSLISKNTNKHISVSDIFEHLTILELAEFIDTYEEEVVIAGETTGIPVDGGRMFELSHSQMRMWFLQKFNADFIANNLPIKHFMNTRVEYSILNSSINALIDRHSALRTVFVEYEGAPRQVVIDKLDFQIEYIDVSKSDDSTELFNKLVKEDINTPFDLSNSLLRMKLFKLEEEYYCIYFNLHHIIVDGWSMDIIVKELLHFYDAFSKGIKPSLNPLKMNYVEFVENQKRWLETDKAASMEQYWLNTLKQPLPALNLPIDFDRPRMQTYGGDFVKAKLNKEALDSLTKEAKRLGCTKHVYLLTLYFVLLYRITGDEDIIVGIPVLSRDNEEIHGLVGLLINTICIRLNINGEQLFSELLSNVREANLKGVKNSKYPFDLLVSKVNPERDFSRSPIFSTIFQFYDNVHLDNESGSQFDMYLQSKEVEDGVELRFDYKTDLFAKNTVQKFVDYFCNIAYKILGNPDIKLHEIDMLSSDEKQLLLDSFNNTSASYESDMTIHDVIKKQATRNPDKIALVFKEESMTYGELDEKSDKLAAYIQSRGFKSGDIAGIMINRCCEMIVGILAVLKAGGAYLPIDPTYPEDRTSFVLLDSGAKLLLTGADNCEIDYNDTKINIKDSTIYENSNNHSIQSITSSNDLAYVIYTSGSTGKPKGVMIEHRAVLNFIKGVTDRIDFDESKSIMALTTISFDIFVLETLLPLTRGMKIVIAGEKEQIDPVKLGLLIQENGVDMLQATPSRMQILLSVEEGKNSLGGLKEIMVGGEAVPAKLVQDIKLNTSARIYNMYGPTETTVWSTIKDLTEVDKITIGSPISNTKIYIISKFGDLQPVGVAGELCIGGDSLARGYLERAELTAERFVYNPVLKGERIYKTGDLARWLPNGDIEYLGRMDYQVKVRGYRIELGEIEDALRKHPEINEVVVSAREDKNEGKYLCAYIVSDKDISVSQLREYLGKTLPEYMIPSYFVMLDKLPSTPNGKIDRKALPEPELTEKEYQAPTNEVESQIQIIWGEILGVPNISINRSFFEVGGDSIQAVKVASLISKNFNKNISVSEIFEYLTISRIARCIDEYEVEKVEVEDVSGEPVQGGYMFELSHSQMRMWFLQRFNPELIANNLPSKRFINSKIDYDILNKSVNKIIDRHAALRTVFIEQKGNPRQVVFNSIDFAIDYVDITQKSNNIELCNKMITEDIAIPFKLSENLMRMKLFKLGEEQYCIYINIHHIIVDGWSLDIVLNEILLCYDAYEKGTNPLLKPLKMKYVQYVASQRKWLETNKAKSIEQYWLDELRQPLPALNLPLDFERPKMQTYNGDFVIAKLGKDALDSIKMQARKLDCTTHVYLLSLYFALLYRITGDEDIIVGVPVLSRDNEEIDNLVGLLINTVSLRVAIDGDKTFTQHLESVRNVNLKGIQNSKYPFDLLVSKVNPERDLSRSPIYSTIFQFYENINMERQTGSQFDLYLQGKEVDDGIELRFDFNTDLFAKKTIEKFVDYFCNITHKTLENPEVKLHEIDMLSSDEKQLLLDSFNNTSVSYESDVTIHEVIKKQATINPDRIALVFKEESMTYGELDEKSDKLAAYIQSRGLKCGDIAGIMINRCCEMIVGILAVLKAGGAYLPIDPSYPQDRTSFMLKDSGARMLLTGEDNCSIDYNDVKINIKDSTIYENCNNQSIEGITSSNDLAYVIYTSGSTGKPKGVMIEHSAVLNLIKGVTDRIDFDESKSIMALTTISFDIFVLETLLPLTRGMKIVIASEQEQIDPAKLGVLIQKNGVDMLQATPSRMQIILSVEEGKNSLRGLKEIMIGGEAVPAKLVQDIKLNTSARIYNMYGPTETTVWSTIKDLTETDKITIGTPVCNTRIYIINKYGNLQPVGVAGELCIGGDGLARGYLERPELTAERFVNNPVLQGERIYKTGDLARWLPNGDIEYLGRMDFQVKVRGYRIELGEIEDALSKLSDISEVVVAAKEDKNGGKYLCAYFISQQDIPVVQLRDYLGKHLPEYMIPSYFMRLDKLPLTPNSKTDRKALPEPVIIEAEYQAPTSEVEKSIQSIWEEVLGIKNISINQKFFEVGGDSMRIVKVYSILEGIYPDILSVSDLFSYPTISKLAKYISSKNEIKAKQEDDDEDDEDIEGLFDRIKQGEMDIGDALKLLIEED